MRTLADMYVQYGCMSPAPCQRQASYVWTNREQEAEIDSSRPCEHCRNCCKATFGHFRTSTAVLWYVRTYEHTLSSASAHMHTPVSQK